MGLRKMDSMAAIKKRMAENTKHEESVQYARILEKVALNTNWYEQKMKNADKYRNQNRKDFHGDAVSELKIIRTRKLQELYAQDAERYNSELAAKGLRILKDKY